jgi:hypothetical protein
MPLITTVAPTDPDPGLKDLSVGLTENVKLLWAVPPGALTKSGPVRAPFGTVVLIFVSESTEYLARTPLNRTAVAPVRLRPVMVTVFPCTAAVGDALVMTGGGATGVTELDGADAGPVPTAFVATTVKV